MTMLTGTVMDHLLWILQIRIYFPAHQQEIIVSAGPNSLRITHHVILEMQTAGHLLLYISMVLMDQEIAEMTGTALWVGVQRILTNFLVILRTMMSAGYNGLRITHPAHQVNAGIAL